MQVIEDTVTVWKLEIKFYREAKQKMLIFKGIIGVIAELVILSLILLVPAQTWNWPHALQLLGALFLANSCLVIWLGIYAPQSLVAQFIRKSEKDQPIADKIITAFFMAFLSLWLIFISYDVFHLHLLPSPSPPFVFLGLLLGCFGYGIIALTIVQNAFAAPIVTVQKKRKQKVIDSGLYAIVCHPMYSGVLWMCIGITLWLGSYSGLLLLILLLPILSARITIEEKVLAKRLQGYASYLKKTRWRLIPFIY